MTRRSRYSIQACHRQIREVAREACHQLYETRMRNNLVYKSWKAQNPGLNEHQLEKRFVDRYWPRCIPFARATLARLLVSPTVDTRTKERIMEVLELDAQLTVGRLSPESIPLQRPN